LGGGARRVPKLRTQVGEVLTPGPGFAMVHIQGANDSPGGCLH